MQKTLFITSCLVLALAVSLGALGAHALHDRLGPDHLSTWHTAVNYQFFHGFAALISAMILWKIDNSKIRWAGRLFLVGILFFSGSIYGLLLLPEGNPARMILGPITPLGGLLFMAAWLLLAWGIAFDKTAWTNSKN